jgi:hypothetical protein
LFEDAGFEVVRLETGEFRRKPLPDLLWIERMLERYGLPYRLRGDDIFAVGRKVSVPRKRYPAWLYSGN